jgi:hypothetical protein
VKSDLKYIKRLQLRESNRQEKPTRFEDEGVRWRDQHTLYALVSEAPADELRKLVSRL